MLKLTNTDSHWRNILATAAISLALTACSGGDSTATPSNAGGAAAGVDVSQFEVEGDHAIGSLDAPVSVIEYASVVCGACANWHTTVYPDFKSKYIDTGKVRFVFREFPTQPANLARAGFLIANCADENKFMENISLQFKRQSQIFASSDIRQEYINLAKAAGLSEDDFNACMNNEAENARLDAVEQAGQDAGVSATPTFMINGEIVRRVEGGDQLFTIESFDTVLGPLLGETSATDGAPE